ncbi:MAG: hypothetical protein KF901_26570 [Myxococcales bacterium]|nr:hypothetical protein [Myxococcales bacterium]
MDSLVEDEDGAVYVEYVLVTILVTLGGAGAVVGLGVPLLNLFRYVEALILLPIP